MRLDAALAYVGGERVLDEHAEVGERLHLRCRGPLAAQRDRRDSGASTYRNESVPSWNAGGALSERVNSSPSMGGCHAIRGHRARAIDRSHATVKSDVTRCQIVVATSALVPLHIKMAAVCSERAVSHRMQAQC